MKKKSAPAWEAQALHKIFSMVVLLFKVLFEMFFTWKYIKIIYFYFLKLFLTSAHQNDIKTLKKINLKQIKK